jgi:hypothetical protein
MIGDGLLPAPSKQGRRLVGATLSFLLAKEDDRGAPAGQEGQRELAVPGSWARFGVLGDVRAPATPNCNRVIS